MQILPSLKKVGRYRHEIPGLKMGPTPALHVTHSLEKKMVASPYHLSLCLLYVVMMMLY